MPDKSGEIAAVGGSRPTETGPGAAGAGPTGGGKAVPDDGVLMGGSGALGDTSSMDDDDLNSGDSLAEESQATGGPQMSPDSPEKSPQNADAPTGGLGGTSSVG